MRSTATARASTTARRASGSPAARALARAGLTARGVLYILIGWVAILVAFGQTSGNQANQAGALEMLAKQPLGLVLLWLLGIGFAGYALWRFSEAAFGVTGEGTGAGPRLKSLVRGLVYAFFAFLTFEIIAGTAGNPSKKQQDLTARVMHHPGGQVLVGIVGAVIVSPYARPDYVCSEVLDHTSVLKLLQQKWNLPALTARVAAANSPLDALDLTAAPAFLTPPSLAEPSLKWGTW